ncbi:MAG: WcbI family polysaccharide biosynthesis putative acetyltransferase, partial [Beijerinckiaceae bacterium]|nr:WcbI family polysaccharide biosynthesis putative acetyltransferase [Beijerinckiaceae bacterium]
MIRDSDALSQIFGVVNRVFGAPSHLLSESTTASDIDGWDSVSHAVFVLELEDAFHVELDFEKTLESRDLGELTAYVASQTRAKAKSAALNNVIIVFGNCQAEAILACLRGHASVVGYEFHYMRSFEIPGQPDAPLDDDALARCVRLWDQSTPLVKFPHRDRLPAGCKITTFPSLDFNLLWPLNAIEPRNHPDADFLFGPFPYGDRVINEVVGEGLSGEAGWAAYLERSERALANLGRLAEIERRRWDALERGLDVKMADHVFERFRSERLFSTYNHPSPTMLSHTGAAILRASGFASGRDHDDVFREVRALFSWAFGDNYEVPVHPYVARTLGLEWWSEGMLYNWHN